MERRVEPALSRRRWVSVSFQIAGIAAGLVAGWVGYAAESARTTATFVFTSDVHYGINRSYFRGEANVEARVVDAAMVQAINLLPAARLPDDGGLDAGRLVGPVEFVVITGDLTNRQELVPLKIQSAAASWAQFETGFIKALALKTQAGRPAPLWLVPGNHDVSNAIGWTGTMVPERDATTLAELYNRMVLPATPRTKDTYRFATDKIIFSRDAGGAHCIFLTIWPDRGARAWIEADLRAVPATTPVFIFCHDPPEVGANHFTNPNGRHDINREDKFENVLDEVYESGRKSDGKTPREQRALATFLKAHRNIVAYFHGHNNWTEFYTWKGPDDNLAVNVFRADSPMKGKFSGPDETKLSFQVVTFDTAAKKLTAREYLWNASAGKPGAPAPTAWGMSKTVDIAPR